MKTRVLLGMSGGTDSSVAAMLLLEQGYDVTGITFRFWDEEENPQYVKDAVRLAEQLNIKHIVKDVRSIFHDTIVRYFIDEYLAGRTPFPCAKCNNELKWSLLFEEAEKLDCEKVSMGHYANIKYDNGHYFIAKGIDEDKDQSFFLWGLSEEQLKRIIFPLGEMTKDKVRKYAAEKGFKQVAEKKDSLGVCFCPGDYRSFLKSQIKDYPSYIYPGNFIDEDENTLGQHEGYPLYTVGQRRGLIYLNRAVFVKEIRPQTNEVVLAPLKSLYKNTFKVKGYRLIDKSLFSNNFDSIVKIRYRKQETMCRIILLDDDRLEVELKEPLESIASGQTAVFYRNDKVLGGGFIE
ncbi:tRNA 2-thiouridine(34) synthase MnmA [Paludibacteraceae bacterium OttesenSCG-928-F17]|nr:tRNA 2-thiouridine(34) synthase MnmA [Paludibacteraceae bacterium OttesenSCG-928-F17]